MITLRQPLLFWTLAPALLAALLCGCASFAHDHRVLSCKIEDLYCDSPDVQVVLAAQKARIEAQQAAVLEEDRQWQERRKQYPIPPSWLSWDPASLLP
jgi:hypothetical protein